MKTPCLLLSVALAAAATPAIAASPFDGTWKTDLSQLKLSDKPDVFLLQAGSYSCKTCIPPYTVPADGQLHAVTGHPYYDAVTVKVSAPGAITVTGRKGDKTVFTTEVSVSPDGNTLTTSSRGTNITTGVESSGTSTATRVAAAPAGTDPISGSWRSTAVQSISDSSSMQTLKVDGNALTLSTPTGEGYTATFGGPAVMQSNDIGKTMIQLRKVSDSHIVETDSRDGKPVMVFDMTVAPDGRTMTMMVTDKRDDSTDTITMLKQ